MQYQFVPIHALFAFPILSKTWFPLCLCARPTVCSCHIGRGLFHLLHHYLLSQGQREETCPSPPPWDFFLNPRIDQNWSWNLWHAKQALLPTTYGPWPILHCKAMCPRLVISPSLHPLARAGSGNPLCQLRPAKRPPYKCNELCLTMVDYPPGFIHAALEQWWFMEMAVVLNGSANRWALGSPYANLLLSWNNSCVHLAWHALP